MLNSTKENKNILTHVVRKKKIVNETINHTPSPPARYLVSSPVAFQFLNVLVLNIAEKLLAGR